jgi:hypothetical protein
MPSQNEATRARERLELETPITALHHAYYSTAEINRR